MQKGWNFKKCQKIKKKKKKKKKDGDTRIK